MENLNELVVFISDKDKSSKKLISVIKQIPDYYNYFSFINIHKEKEITKKSGVKLIPSVLYKKDLFTGDDTISIIFWALDINTEPKKQKEEKKSLSGDYEDEQYCNPENMDIPKFQDPMKAEIVSDKKISDTDIEKYYSSRQELDNIKYNTNADDVRKFFNKNV